MVGCGLPVLAFVAAVQCLLDLTAGGGAPRIEIAYTWADIGGSTFEIAFYFDRLTAVMALIVTGVGSLIHLYSIGYMKDDASYARYFAYLNLFLFFMLLLVLGRSLLVLFVGWEGVGLASYLLIGFWFEDPDKARAGKKAFITNRIGDAGFLLGMFVLYQALGTLDMDRINAAFMATTAPAVSASLVGILLFIGATGKSAQIPLHVWLPDAMAGPTPVSALIHAATMVTAGVYLVARLSGIYLQAPEASAVIAAIGAATAFFAATIAVVQTDIKKVLAYSTISQLGFMFVALGVGAYGVAIFHLYTHAFFKACLFLGAGSVIHALGGEQDVREDGRSRAADSDHVRDLRRGDRGHRRHPAARRLLLQGRDPLVRLREQPRRRAAALRDDGHDRAADGLLHVPPAVAHVPRPLADDPRSRAPRARIAGVDDGRAGRAGRAVRDRRLPVDAALSRAIACRCPKPCRALEHLETPLLVLSIVIAFAGLALAAYLYGGDGAPRRTPATPLRGTAPRAFRQVLRRRSVRPVHRAAVVLDLGSRLPAPRRPGASSTARCTASPRSGAARPAGLSRIQNGQLHFYALLVLVGIIASLAWSWRHV